jgi:hypothetical protein
MTETCEEVVGLNRSPRGRRAKAKPAEEAPPPRIPRITRLMALAIKFQDMIDQGEVRDYADIARLGLVTRARLTQIMNLTLLAPEIQESLLLGDAPPTAVGWSSEREVRRLVKTVVWRDQAALLRTYIRLQRSARLGD